MKATQHKSNKKVISISPSTLSKGADVCHNLQPSPINEQLIPIPPLATISEGNYEPFHYLQLDDGTLVVLFLSGTAVYHLIVNNEESLSFPSQPIYITTLDERPLCAVNSGNTIYLMMPNGAYRLDFNADYNNWTDLGYMPPFPPLEITATENTEFSATIPAIPLNGNYPHWRGTLNKADLSTLSTHLLEAYTELKQNATATGFFIQPVLARYHLLDRDGNVIFTSQPIMVSVPSGFQCTNLLTFSTNDFSTLNSLNLIATGYKISVSTTSLANSPWADVVASAVVEVTPLLDPIDAKASAQCRLDAIDSTHGNLAVYMPGTSVTMTPADNSRCDMVKTAVASFETIASELAQFPYPYSNGINTTIFSSQSHFVNARHAATPPFAAQSALAMGDTILWGNVSMLRPSAPSLPFFAASRNNESGFWRACVSITFSSGDERVVWSDSGNNNCPSLLSPLLAYPCNDAKEISISISCDGVVVRESFPLSPLPGSNYTIFLHPSLKPFAITTTTDMYIVPSQHIIRTFKAGSVAVSRLNNPFNLLATQSISCGNIVTFTPAVRSTSSWDFARTHAYAFSTSGVYAISVNAAKNAISAHIIDNRHVKSKKHVTFANSSVYAIASGDLISITGSKAATLRRNIDASDIAWDNNTHFLWIYDNSSKMRVINFERNIEASCDALSNAQLFSADGNLLISNGNEVKSPNLKNTISTPIKWQHTIFLDSSQSQIIGATFFIASSQFDGTISIRAHSGAGTENSYPITTLNIKGAINAPIPIRIYAPHHSYLIININANVSPDFIFSNITLQLS